MVKNFNLPQKEHDLKFKYPINRWDEALPLGNGLTGCLLWGNGSPLRFSLDRGDLWDLRLAPETLSEDFTYANLVELVRKGKQDAIVRQFDHIYEKYPYPTKLPAGRLEFDFGRSADEVESRLNIREASAEVKLVYGNQYATVNTFLHAVDGLGYIKITGTHLDRAMHLVPPNYAGSEEEQSGKDPVFHTGLPSLGYPSASKESDGKVSWFYQKTCHELEYAVVIAERSNKNNESEYVYTIASNQDGEQWLEEAKRKVKSALEVGFDVALHAHCEWWKCYWEKSSITIPDQEVEKQWYLTNYMLASCSRKGAPPMPLQGVWTADEGMLPPWKGDYHNDLNTQLSYWHYLKANHLEEGESFLDFLWNLRPQAQQFAKTFFDAPGINLPSVMTINGKAMGGWSMYSLSITNQIWLCQAFDHYWLYTGDKEFLRDKTYVYFKETATCILRWLAPSEDGKLRLPVSSSPEIHDNTLNAWLTPNSNYDLSLLIYLFSRLEDMAERLGDQIDLQLWRDTKNKLPELAVNENDVLMISPDESLMVSHRHMSHMMPIYPLQLLDHHNSERDRKVMAASIANLEVLGKGQWVGYSFAWAAAMYAQQGNGEATLYHLQQFWKYMCSPNGFHLNGDYKNAGVTMFHYRPFTLEGNFAAACALQEMLLQTDHETIRVFPAIPKSWSEQIVEFGQFRGEMGVLVSARVSEGKLEYIELYAERDGVFHVQNNFCCEQLDIQLEKKVTVQSYSKKEIMSFELKAGEMCKITPATPATEKCYEHIV